MISQDAGETVEDVFERWAWLYALCRERVFADHTELIARIMSERFVSTPKPVMVELGCGPGFYSIGLAERFDGWQFVGIDRSRRLLKRARARLAAKAIRNCTFCRGDATCASAFPVKADLVLASRLLFILPDRASALRAMYAGLRPGGMLLIAEPRSGWRTWVARGAMKALRSVPVHGTGGACDHMECRALGEGELSLLLGSLAWVQARSWSDRHYQYFLCEKAASKASDEVHAAGLLLSVGGPGANGR